MSTIVKDQAEESANYIKILNSIDSDRSILLFPVRLETHRRRSKTIHCSRDGSQTARNVSTNELLVRIFPDEVELDYYDDRLTEQQISDGKHFWLQWFIASGNQKREYEAWQVLCSKYSIDLASWISRLTRPVNLDEYLLKRPYPLIDSVEAACSSIYVHLGKTLLDENSKMTEKGYFEDEEVIDKNLQVIHEDLSNLEDGFRNVDFIVDYLYDEINEVIIYLKKRIEFFKGFYTRHSDKYISATLPPMTLWDADYMQLRSMYERVKTIHKSFDGRRKPLDEMINMYLEEKKNEIFFPKVAVKSDKEPSQPKCSILPDRFVFLGEADTGHLDGWKIVRYGKKIDKRIAFSLIHENKISIDNDANLTNDGQTSWMIDYDKAEQAGMAITVPLDPAVERFRYIYVLGIRGYTGNEGKILSQLFNSHNYLSSGLSFIKSGTPTNLVDGVTDTNEMTDDEKMKARYEIEVREIFKCKNPENDASVLSKMLGIDYNDCLGRITGFSNTQISEESKAIKSLWNEYVAKNLKGVDENFDKLIDFIGNFMANYVKAAGPMPAFRLGDNPYGILPVTDYERVLTSIKAGDSDSVFLKILYDNIVSLGDKWHVLRDSKVIEAGNLSGTDADEKFLKMSGQNARGVKYKTRAMIESPLLQDRDVSDSNVLGFLDNGNYFRSTLLSDCTKDYDFSDMVKVIKEEQPALSDERAKDLAGEFIDLLSYRLDAWYTGMVCSLRNSSTKKTPAIGAFGWIFNLRLTQRSIRKDSSKIAKEMGLPEGVPIFEEKSEKAGHYIMAPSVQHAMTAAVLRSAYLNTKSGDKDSHMCINLSSSRARQALRLLEDVKSGLSTGVVLGADLERGLHDAYKHSGKEMDKYIYPLRKLFPQSIDIESETKRGQNYAMEVINGESLLNTFIEKWDSQCRVSEYLSKSQDQIPWIVELKKDSSLNDKNDLKTLFCLIERMQDSYDALNDLLLSEGVFRLVCGDKESFVAISSFMTQGKGNVPKPAILDTPWDHVAVSERVALALPRPNAKPLSAMAIAEPAINDYVLSQLGSMRNIVFYIEKSGAISTCSLADIDIDPIEYLYISGNDVIFRNLLETKWRILNKDFVSEINILTGAPTQLERDEVLLPEKEGTFTVYEDSLRMEALRKMISRSRRMKASDFAPGRESDTDLEEDIDFSDLEARLSSVKDFLKGISIETDYLLSEISSETELSDDYLSKLYSICIKAVESGIFQASVKFDTSLSLGRYSKIDDRIEYDKAIERQKQFVAKIASIKESVQSKLIDSEKIALTDSDSYCEAIKALIGNYFKVVPSFNPSSLLDAAKLANLSKPRKTLESFRNVTSSNINEWLEEIAEVRTGVRCLKELLSFQSMAGYTDPQKSIYQIKASGESGAEWLGRQVSSESQLDDADTMVIVDCNNLSRFSSDGNISGLILDSWMEYIPYEKNTAGMAINIDQPDAEAPQALLLVTYPEFGIKGSKQHWDFKYLQNVLDSTRFMVMNRAVDPDSIYDDGTLSKLLPLLSNAGVSGNFSIISPSSENNRTIKEKLLLADEQGIFNLMPGGFILEQFLLK